MVHHIRSAILVKTLDRFTAFSRNYGIFTLLLQQVFEAYSDDVDDVSQHSNDLDLLTVEEKVPQNSIDFG